MGFPAQPTGPRAGERLLDLTESNPTRAGIAYPPEILAAFDDPAMLAYDPAPAGARPAREAVAAYHAARGVRVEPARILLTASSSEAYAYLFKLLADPGDDVLAPRPSYPLFEFLAAMESVEVRAKPSNLRCRYRRRWRTGARWQPTSPSQVESEYPKCPRFSRISATKPAQMG